MGIMMLRRGDTPEEQAAIRERLADAARTFLGEWDAHCGGDVYRDPNGVLYWTPGNGDPRLTREAIEAIANYVPRSLNVYDVTAGIPDRFERVIELYHRPYADEG